MRKVLGTALAAATLAAGAATLAAPAQAAPPAPSRTDAAAAAGGTVHGCPHGDVCVYPRDKGWNNDKPTASMKYFQYGWYNFTDQVGHHYVLNNQIGSYGATTLCYGYGGTKCTGPTYTIPWDFTHAQGSSWGNPDLTKINSIRLYPAT